MSADIDRHQFGDRVRMLLLNRRVTGRAVAKLLKVPEQQFSRYVHGTIPDAAILLKLARWGECSVDWLLTGHAATRARQGAPQEKPLSQENQLNEILEGLRRLDVTVQADLLELLAYADKGNRFKLLMNVYLHIVTELLGLEAGERALPVRDRKAFALTNLLLTLCQATLPVKHQEQLWLKFGLALPRPQDSPSANPTEYLPQRLGTIMSQQPNTQPSAATIRKMLLPIRSSCLTQKQLHRIATQLLSLGQHHTGAQFSGLTKSSSIYPSVHMALVTLLEEATAISHTKTTWKAFTDDILSRIVGSSTSS